LAVVMRFKHTREQGIGLVGGEGQKWETDFVVGGAEKVTKRRTKVQRI